VDAQQRRAPELAGVCGAGGPRWSRPPGARPASPLCLAALLHPPPSSTPHTHNTFRPFFATPLPCLQGRTPSPVLEPGAFAFLPNPQYNPAGGASDTNTQYWVLRVVSVAASGSGSSGGGVVTVQWYPETRVGSRQVCRVGCRVGCLGAVWSGVEGRGVQEGRAGRGVWGGV
jgi:hypothetical protein